MASDPRDSYQWKQVRKRLVRSATVCEICWRPLVHDAPPRSPWSPSVDHVTPLALGGAPFASTNLRVVHYRCNSKRGAGRRRVPRRQSRVW